MSLEYMGDIPLQIAIDGPVAAGKGDVASRLAKKLHLTYIYTGAMYRMLALACINNTIVSKDHDQVLNLLTNISMDLAPPDISSQWPCRALLNGQDVTERIFSQDVAIGASDVGVIPEVRKIMVTLQQNMVQGKSVVMEGRDIGSRVLPKAQLKIFLTADLEERAKRRYLQWKQNGIDKSFTETLTDTKMRDFQDVTRKTDPLQKMPDAWELDTTNKTQDQVVDAIINELKKRQLV